MDNVYTQTDHSIIFLVIILVLMFVFFNWMKTPTPIEPFYQQPYYNIYYVTPNENKQHFKVLEDKPKINTESITIGNHNSSHNSAIIASPYNPPKMNKFPIYTENK